MGVCLAETTGFEPATYGLTGHYANRYTTSPRFKVSTLCILSFAHEAVKSRQPWRSILQLGREMDGEATSNDSNLLHDSRNLAPGGCIADMCVVMLPENTSSLHKKYARHLPRIADGHPLAMALSGRSQTTDHDTWGEHLRPPAPFYAKGLVQLALWVCNCRRLGPGAGKERCAIRNSARVDKENGGKV